MEWSDVNFYTNDFSEDVGMALLNPGRIQVRSYDSPDPSTDGDLRKRWIVSGGASCLLKGGCRPFGQEPYNEVIASELMQLIGVEHVGYSLVCHDGEVFSSCPAFASTDAELVPAWAILKDCRRREGQTQYGYVRDSFESLGLEGCGDFFDRMICVDFIIANEDRHLGNFGIIRDPESLEIRGFAPMYDNGTSLGCRTETI